MGLFLDCRICGTPRPSPGFLSDHPTSKSATGLRLWLLKAWKRQNSITLSSSRPGLRADLPAGSRAGLWPASELDSVMEFDQIPLRCPAIQLAGCSQTWFSTCRRQVRAISTCWDSSNLVTDRFAAGLRPSRELVRELLARWIATDRPNSRTLSSSLAGCRPAREPAE